MKVGARDAEHIRDGLHRPAPLSGDCVSQVNSGAGLDQSLLQDLHLEGLAPKLALKLADALLHLPRGSVAGDLVIVGHGDGSSLQHQASPTVEQVRGHPIATVHDRDAGPLVRGRLGNAELLGSTPATATAANGDDLNVRHKHVLRRLPKPP
jgi:hypothetical protein